MTNNHKLMRPNQYIATLSVNVSFCLDSVRLFKELDKGDIKGLSKIKDELLDVLVVYIVLRSHCLFDRTKGVVSFEKVRQYLGGSLKEAKIKLFEDEYNKIKDGYKDLIERIKNNRTIGIAHIQKEEELGWDKAMCDQINEMMKEMGLEDQEDNLQPVEDNYIHITRLNIPIQDIEKMLTELRSLIYNFLF